MRKTEIAALAVVSLSLSVVIYADGRPARHDAEGINPQAAEALIYGRVAKSDRDGILSAAALLGQCATRDESLSGWNTDLQRAMYEAGRCDRFVAYYSQTGLQGMLFSALSALRVPVAAFELLAAVCMAVALTLLFAWVAAEFGLSPALVGAALTMLHRWPMLLGDNLFMLFGAMYLPMIALLFALRAGRRRILLLTTVWLTARWLLVGAEFLFAGLAMSFVPLAYYALAQRWPPRRWVDLGLQIAAGTAISLAVAGTILTVQVASQSSLESALEHFTYTTGKRTWGDPRDYPSRFESGLTASTSEMLQLYAEMPAIRLGGTSLAFRDLLIALIFFTILAAAIQRRSRSRALLAFIVVTWVSIAPPLCWVLIAKAHAHRHVWVDPIVWYMPFLLLGNALVGIVLARGRKLFRPVGSPSRSTATSVNPARAVSVAPSPARTSG